MNMFITCTCTKGIHEYLISSDNSLASVCVHVHVRKRSGCQSTLRPGWITSPLPVRGHLIQHMGIEFDQKPLFCIVHIFYKLI